MVKSSLMRTRETIVGVRTFYLSLHDKMKAQLIAWKKLEQKRVITSRPRNRKVVMSRLINPIVNLEFHQISTRAKKLPPGADEFTAFLKTYLARWAGHAGVLY
jgi:hypothetical protein